VLLTLREALVPLHVPQCTLPACVNLNALQSLPTTPTLKPPACPRRGFAFGMRENAALRGRAVSYLLLQQGHTAAPRRMIDCFGWCPQ
jgi:hypothetical protein